MHFNNYPILKVLVPYILGILLPWFVSFPHLNCPLLLGFIFIIILLISILYKFSSYNFQFYLSLSLYFISFFIGILFSQQKITEFSRLKTLKNGNFYTVFVLDAPQEKRKIVKVLVEIEQTDQGVVIQQKAMLNLEKSSAAMDLQCGDLLWVKADLQRFPSASNPYMFDVHKYMQKKGIYYTAYIPSHAWIKLASTSKNSLKKWSTYTQSFFASLFKQNGLQGDEYAVITAILLGDDEAMDPELRGQYAAVGASHILCVSGMHVGIIFMIISFLLKPFARFPSLKLLTTLISIVLIWAYANVTGLSPSVMRSATMFTFVLLGTHLRRPTSVYHSLFASLFFLLICNPLVIFEIGFQMSYAAVFGIVWVQPKLAQLWRVNNRVGKYFWDLITVSCAAQLATAPLATYYFGQFSNYFLLTNLSIISLSFVVVVTGVLLLILAWIPPLTSLLGKVLTLEIKIMNHIIRFIDALPCATLDMIPLHIPQVMLIYGIIIVLIFWFIYRHKLLKYLLLSFILLLGTLSLFYKIDTQNQEQFLVLAAPRAAAIHLQTQYSAWLFLDSNAVSNPNFYSHYVKNLDRYNAVRSQIIPWDTAFFAAENVMKCGNFLCFKDKKLYILSGKQKLYPDSSRIAVDALYVMNNARMPFYKLTQSIDFKLVILDGTLSSFYRNRWIDSCQAYTVPYHSTHDWGYLYLYP